MSHPVVIPDRIWERVDRNGKSPESRPELGPCWIWTGYITPKGYGRIGLSRRSVLTHRLFFEAHEGPVPVGLQLDHLCRVRHCCNPKHLEVVEPRENTMRGQTIAAANAAKRECPKGHPYDESNTYLRPGFPNDRRCRACQREHNRVNSRRYRIAKKEAAA